MPELARPWVLLLLPGLLAWWFWRSSGTRPALPQFLGEEGEGDLFVRIRPPLPRYLRACALSILLLALAGPQTRRERPLPPHEGLALMVALDLSGSMGRRNSRGESRLDMARGEIAPFLRARPHDRIGLVTFGEEALTRVPPTTNHDHLLHVLDNLEAGRPEEGTALGAGLGLAAHGTLSVPTPSRVVLLFTDGRNNAGSLSPLSAAEAAGVLDIRLHAIGVGGTGGEEPLDEPLLRAVAGAGGGRYFRVQDAAGLREVLRAIDEMETGPVGERAGFAVESRHRGLLLLALLFLGLEAVLSAGPRGRIV